MTSFAENGGMMAYTVDSIRRTLFSAGPVGEVAPARAGWTVEFLDWADPTLQEQKRSLNPPVGWTFLQGSGVRRGKLLGGCVEVLDWLPGTQVWPDLAAWQDAILFLETSEDAPPPVVVSYHLRHLAAMGILQRLAGILFARPGGAVNPLTFGEYDRAILQVVTEEEGLIDIPVITGMDFGHTDPVFVLPVGVEAEIDCDARRFSIIENAVED